VSARHDEWVTVNRRVLFVLVNLTFVALTVIGYAIHSDSPVHPLYVILLFALCTTPMIDATVLNGPYSFLVLFSFYFFLMFGALDCRELFFNDSGWTMPSQSVLTMPEIVILVGALSVQIAYRFACKFFSRPRSKSPPMDWSERTLVLVGITMWVVCTRLNWEFTVNILTEPTSAAVARGLGSLNAVQIMIFLLARLAQPLSILIIAYAQCRYHRPYMMPVVFGLVLFQLFIGFVIDFKTEALIGGVLVVLTNLLVNGRVPKIWVGLMLVMVAVAFPLLQANRAVRSDRAQNTTQVSQNVFGAFQQTLAAKEKVNTGRERAQTALERLTLKGSVNLIVDGTGKVAPFKNGYTLTPIITTFIPRIIWPDKPSIETGRILNKDFHLSESADTYMSPSHLGELYWNFGWPGVVVGMTLIGLILGTLGGKFNLAEAATITRVLVVIVTVRFLILAAEGEIATHYVSWLRAMVGIGLLHLFFARIPWAPSAGDKGVTADSSSSSAQTATRPSYPNILR
jgi:hypothetical protein